MTSQCNYRLKSNISIPYSSWVHHRPYTGTPSRPGDHLPKPPLLCHPEVSDVCLSFICTLPSQCMKSGHSNFAAIANPDAQTLGEHNRAVTAVSYLQNKANIQTSVTSYQIPLTSYEKQLTFKQIHELGLESF